MYQVCGTCGRVRKKEELPNSPCPDCGCKLRTTIEGEPQMKVCQTKVFEAGLDPVKKILESSEAESLISMGMAFSSRAAAIKAYMDKEESIKGSVVTEVETMIEEIPCIPTIEDEKDTTEERIPTESWIPEDPIVEEESPPAQVYKRAKKRIR